MIQTVRVFTILRKRYGRAESAADFDAYAPDGMVRNTRYYYEPYDPMTKCKSGVATG